MRSAGEFDEFYASTCRRLIGQVYAMVGNLAEAEDAVQEAFCRAWQRRGRLGEYDNAEAWVRTVAYRIAVSAWRKGRNRLIAHRRYGVPEAVPDADAEHLAMLDALRTLPYEQRRAIVLYHLVGLPVEEIARETESPVGTVKSRLSRARAALAGHFTEYPSVREVAEDV